MFSSLLSYSLTGICWSCSFCCCSSFCDCKKKSFCDSDCLSVVACQHDVVIMAYVPMITSFLIVWIETWFLDFKVLPQEQTYREALGKYNTQFTDLLSVFCLSAVNE